jgi:GPH family glycoside/pentoside/hexuronide:cation symporter
MELVRNRPLRVLSIFFIIAFTAMSVSNAADSYFMTYNIGATPFMTTAFMWMGTIPAFIFLPLVPAVKKKIGKAGMFRLFLGISILGMLLMYAMVSLPALRDCFPLLCVVQFIKSAGVLVATGYMWALVPEVVTFGEYTTGRRVAAIVGSLICIFMKAGMALGGVIPGLVLAWVGFNGSAQVQTPLAEQGILWLVTLIPAVLFVLAMYIIGKYELSDERMDEINMEIAKRR